MAAIMFFGPSFPVNLKPKAGSTIVRVYTMETRGLSSVPTRNLEYIVILEKEGAFLRVIKSISQVEVNLAGVCLDLTEIRIVGSVRGDLQVKPTLAVRLRLLLFSFLRRAPASCPYRWLWVKAGRSSTTRLYFSPVRETGWVCRRMPPCSGRRAGKLERSEVRTCCLMMTRPIVTVFLLWETDAFQRDLDFHAEALVIDLTFAVPDRVEVGLQVSGRHSLRRRLSTSNGLTKKP